MSQVKYRLATTDDNATALRLAGPWRITIALGKLLSSLVFHEAGGVSGFIKSSGVLQGGGSLGRQSQSQGDLRGAFSTKGLKVKGTNLHRVKQHILSLLIVIMLSDTT